MASEITFDGNVGNLGQFTIDADTLLSVVAELISNGVRGHEKFPMFGQFLKAMTKATEPK